MKLKFISKNNICSDIWQLHFIKPTGFKYSAGQYLETLIPDARADERGNTRWFTMSSSPTQKDIIITTRLVSKHSEFKDDLFHLKSGDAIAAKGPMGEFVLPNKTAKITWIAGGIGVTPFISQLQFLLDTKDLSRDITLIHGLQELNQNPCADLIKKCQEAMPNFKLIQVISGQTPKGWSGPVGYIDDKVIKNYLVDYTQRDTYVSGPEPMVDAIAEMLTTKLKVSKDKIHQDWFPGYKEKY